MALPATDTFNRADGGLGANWATLTGTSAPTISSNQVAGVAAAGMSAARWVADAFGANHYAECVIGPATANCGPMVRAQSGAQTAYYAQVNGANCFLVRMVAGATNAIGNVLGGWATGQTVRLRAVDSTLELYRDGTLVLSITDATITGGGGGIWLFGTTSRLDTFVADTITPPAAPSGLTATATGQSTIALQWVDNATGESGYQIERDSGGGFVLVGTVGANATTYTDGGLAGSTTYTYRVRATSSNGVSTYSGTAAATTEAGPPTLTLKIAWPDGPYAASPTYTDMTSRLRNDQPVVIVRGRNNELGRVEAGSATFTLHNRDRALDPLNTASPYYPNVLPRRLTNVEVTFAGTTYDLFTGLARFGPAWGKGGSQDHTVAVRATDALDLFARTPLIDVLLVDAWQPGGLGIETLNIIGGVPMAGGGQFKVRLSAAPDGTGQTVEVFGYDQDGLYTSEVFAMGSGNWQSGVVGSTVFFSVYAVQSTRTGATHKAISVVGLPAYGGTVGVGGVAAEAGAHIGQLLDYVGWPAGQRALDKGDVRIASWAATQDSGWVRSVASSVADTILTAFQRLQDSEGGGIVFIRGDGAVVFHSRGRRTSMYYPDAPILGSGAGEIPYRDPVFSDGDDDVITEVRLTRYTGSESRATAQAADLAVSGRRTYAQGGLLASFSTLVQAWAGRLVFHRGRAVPRVTSVTIDGTPANWATLLSLDISRVVIVRLRPPGATTPIDRPCFVERLEWRFVKGQAGVNGSLTLGLSPAELGNDLYRYVFGS